MREIKFRGKSVISGIWCYGSLIIRGSTYFIEEHYPCSENRKWQMFEVDLKTVGQYTSVEDRNGTGIYEGDILKKGDRVLELYHDGFVYMVRHHDKRAKEHRVEDHQAGYGIFLTHEVIGNIHDNPDF